MVWASGSMAQDRIRVYVVTPVLTEGFIDTTSKGLQDSFADLMKDLKKIKTFDVVELAVNADITIELLERNWKNTGGTTTRTTIQPLGGFRSRTSNDRNAELTIVLKTGSYEMTFSRNDDVIPTWRGLASLLAKDVEGWIKKNREKLLADRLLATAVNP